MKSSELKKLIKDAVQEAIKDELRDILLEAVRANKNPTPLTENKSHVNPLPSVLSSTPPSTLLDQRKAYADILNSMTRNGDTMNFNTQGMGLSHIPSDTVSEGSSLPAGDVSLDMIMNLTGGK